MIIDDEKDLLFVYKKTLEIGKIQVSTFDDPIKALEYFRKDAQKFNLLLTDMKMPGIDGFEVINQVKLYNPNIKVVLISAYNISDEQIIQNLNSGVKIDKYICKPVSIDELRDIIVSLLI